MLFQCTITNTLYIKHTVYSWTPQQIGQVFNSRKSRLNGVWVNHLLTKKENIINTIVRIINKSKSAILCESK